MLVAASICPACQARTLCEHCASHTCTWHRCLSPTCQLLVSLSRRRGVIPVPGSAGRLFKPVLLTG